MTSNEPLRAAGRYRFGNFLLDDARRELRESGRRVDVQRKVLDLLLYLARHRDRAVSKDELIEAVWPGVVVTESVLARAIMKARRAVHDDADGAQVIRTVHGHGYQFVARLEGSEGVTQAAAMPPPRAAGPAAGAASVPIQTATLAVLPFANLSPDPEHGYFATGIHEEILNEIARRTGIRVIARTSVAQYTDTDKPIPVIAAELGVANIVEGSIRYAGGAVRINAHLIEGATGVRLWSHTYDRTFADIFAIQTDVAQRIAGALQAQMSGAGPDRPSTPARVAAYEQYLIARSLRERAFAGGWAPVLEHVQRALALDPDFIPALWLLHNAYQNRMLGGSDAQALEEMRRLTARAEAAEPDHALTLALRAKDAGFAWQWAAAMALWERAIAADPTDPVSLGNAAFAALGVAATDRALELARAGIRADPGHDWPRFAYLTALRAAGDFAAGRHEAEVIVALGGDRRFPAAVTLLLDAVATRDGAAAARLGAELVRMAGPRVADYVALLEGLARDEPVDTAVLRRTQRIAPPPNANQWMLAHAYAAAGDDDGAFAMLDQIAATHSMYSAIRVRVDPAFAALRADRRYRRFLAAVSAPEGPAPEPVTPGRPRSTRRTRTIRPDR